MKNDKDKLSVGEIAFVVVFLGLFIWGGYVWVSANLRLVARIGIGIGILVPAVLLIIAGMYLFSVLKEQITIKKKVKKIRDLKRSTVFDRSKTEPEKGLHIDAAVNRGAIRIVSLTGDGIYSAKIEVERLKDSYKEVVILIPLGTVLTSSGDHQNMVVRDDMSVSILRSAIVSVPVTCLDFHKSVPKSSDTFSGIAKASQLICAILEVARAVDVDHFVTQLAVWIAVDNISPAIVSIGPLLGQRRQPTKSEARWAREIAAKGKELAK